MKMHKMSPSKYFRAADVSDGPVVVTIDRIDMERVGDDTRAKPVVTFKEVDQRLVLNKTNGSRLAELFGSDDTDDWLDKKIVLVYGHATFGSRTVGAIRVESPAELAKRSPFTNALPA
jgi:hypothetical protein